MTKTKSELTDNICPNCGKQTDNVRNPQHYKLDGLDVEAIDVIRSVLGPAGFQGYCRGNVLKYLTRADKKNGAEDLEKARVYLTWEIESRKEEETGK